MLSFKPWRASAVLRLVASMFLCMYAGSLVAATAHYVRAYGSPGAKYGILFGAAFVLTLAALVLIQIRWRLQRLLPALGVAVVCFYGGMILGAWAEKLAGSAGPSVMQMIVATVSFQGAGIILISLFLSEHHLDWLEGFGLANGWRRALALGILLGWAFLPVGWLLQWGSAELMTHLPRLNLKPEEQEAVQTLRIATGTGSKVILGLLTVLVAPVAEECLFRGILYPWVKQAGFPRLALWGTSFLFAAVHMNAPTFIPLALLALLLAILYERTDNLLAPIATHSVFNGLNFVLLFLLRDSVAAR